MSSKGKTSKTADSTTTGSMTAGGAASKANGTTRKDKAAAPATIPVELTPDHLADLRRAFDLFDPEGIGRIKAGDVKVALYALGFDVSKDELNTLLSYVGTTVTGEMDFHDFLQVLKMKMNDQEIRSEVVRSFRLLDRNQKGFLTLDDLLEAAILAQQYEITEEELLEMMQFANQMTQSNLSSNAKSNEHDVPSGLVDSTPAASSHLGGTGGVGVIVGEDQDVVTEQDFLSVMRQANVFKN